jgi:hypothetical protein
VAVGFSAVGVGESLGVGMGVGVGVGVIVGAIAIVGVGFAVAGARVGLVLPHAATVAAIATTTARDRAAARADGLLPTNGWSVTAQ